MSKDELWQATLGELELILSKANFNTWFKDTFVVDLNNDCIIVGVPNTFTQSWLQNKYHQAIQTAIKNILNKPIKEIIYKVETIKKGDIQTNLLQSKPSFESSENRVPTNQTQSKLNNKYQFNSFIVGKNNELAHAAGRAVAQKPGETYNPFFIYGGVGLGKTHLMQAIGHQSLQHNPNIKVLYTTCETFTNEFVQAIKSGNTKSFQDRYRSVDVLIIDDIHFIAGKTETQEQFFHTFNELHQNNKQIILSSDRAPASIPTIEARLRSRFSWGMIVDISQPDVETRTAILETKISEKNINLPEEIINYIALNIQSNVRELEGALNKVIAHFNLTQTKPNIENTKEILATLSSGNKKGIVTPKHILRTVSEYYDVAIEHILGASRKKGLVLPRQITMYLMREEINASFPTIGLEMGNRDHTTVMHACKKIINEIEKDEKLSQNISILRQRIYD